MLKNRPHSDIKANAHRCYIRRSSPWHLDQVIPPIDSFSPIHRRHFTRSHRRSIGRFHPAYSVSSEKHWTTSDYFLCNISGICTANNHQSPSPAQSAAQHHIYCQPFFGLKWVVFFAGKFGLPLTKEIAHRLPYSVFSSDHDSSLPLLSSRLAWLTRNPRLILI